MHRYGAQPLPGYLTANPRKRDLYALDPFYVDAAEQVAERWGHEAPALFHITAVVLLKPDAIVGRRADAAIDWLSERGFVPRAARVVHIDRIAVREMWRYRWNTASSTRRRICDLLVTNAPSLYLALQRDGDIAALEVLGGSKGAGDPRKLEAGQLRHHLGSVNELINFVHTPDEPADLVREMGILFDDAARVELLDALRDRVDGRPALELAISDLYAAHAPRDLDLAAALRRLTARLSHGATCSGDRCAPCNAIELLNQIAAGRAVDWDPLERWLREVPNQLDRWDVTLAATSVAPEARAEIFPVA